MGGSGKILIYRNTLPEQTKMMHTYIDCSFQMKEVEYLIQVKDKTKRYFLSYTIKVLIRPRIIDISILKGRQSFADLPPQ